MNFKTLLVHLDHTDRCSARVALAARIAKAQGAHVVGLLPNGMIDGTIPADAIPEGMTDYIAESARYLRVRAEGIREGFAAVVNAQGPVSHEVREVEGTTIDEVIAHGRSSDLIVLGQEDRAIRSDVPARSLVPQAMLHAGRPVLVVPYAGEFKDTGKRVLIAWDGSRAAAVAMRDALPLMAGASRVTLVTFRRTGAHEEQALLTTEMRGWLQRHGIRAEAEQNTIDIDPAEALLSRVSDLGADLIVMGGYGHSRVREWVLGGVTRGVLTQMTVPVLMSH